MNYSTEMEKNENQSIRRGCARHLKRFFFFGGPRGKGVDLWRILFVEAEHRMCVEAIT